MLRKGKKTLSGGRVESTVKGNKKSDKLFTRCMRRGKTSWYVTETDATKKPLGFAEKQTI